MSLSKQNYERFLYGIIILLSVYRFSYFGFNYIPYLDDYVQYSFYPDLEDCWERVYTGGTGVLFTRPLAGILDFFLWSRFRDCLGVAVIILSVLHGISAIIFRKVLELCHIQTGLMFWVVYVFLPLNCEGTYWVSAATRIIPPMFLSAIAMLFAAQNRYGLFTLATFLSVWFYEQTAALSLVTAALVCVMKKDYKKIIIPLLAGLMLVVFYLSVGKMGDNSHRIRITDLAGLMKNLKNTSYSFFEIISDIQFKIIFKGFFRGITQVASDFALLWVLTLAMLAICACVLSGKRGNQSSCRCKLAVGVLLVITPLLPFVVLEGSFLNLRNIVPSSLGLALIVDFFASFLSEKWSNIISGVLIFVFVMAGVSEVGDYNFTAMRDYETAVKISEEVTPDTKSIRVNISSPVYYPQNAPYRDHIMSMTGSDWGVTGIVRTISKNTKILVENQYEIKR